MEKKKVVIEESKNPFTVWVSNGFDLKKLESVEGVAYLSGTGIKNSINVWANPCYNLEEVKSAIQTMIEAQ
jgi:hypothetical protein